MIQIFRHEHTEDGTFGVLSVAGEIICFSLELPWRSNQNGISCIPPGLYTVRQRATWFGTEKFGPTYQVEDVPGRNGILFHVGNTIADLKGCIAPGMSIGRIDRRAVLSSSAAFRLFLERMNNAAESSLLITSFDVGPYCHS